MFRGNSWKELVGASGFEPPASWSRTRNQRIISNLAVGTLIYHRCAMLLVIKGLGSLRGAALAMARNPSMRGVGTKMGTVSLRLLCRTLLDQKRNRIAQHLRAEPASYIQGFADRISNQGFPARPHENGASPHDLTPDDSQDIRRNLRSAPSVRHDHTSLQRALVAELPSGQKCGFVHRGIYISLGECALGSPAPVVVIVPFVRGFQTVNKAI